MSLIAQTPISIDADTVEDAFLSEFETTVMVWIHNHIIHIDVLGNTPKMDEFKKMIETNGIHSFTVGGVTYSFQKN